LTVSVLTSRDLQRRLPRWEAWLLERGPLPLSRHPLWLRVLEDGLRHVPFAVEASEGDRVRGLLPLTFVRSFLFGRYLVSLPYLNSGGPVADDPGVARGLVDEAVRLAEALDVRHLELREEKPLEHPALDRQNSTKVHMRLALPADADTLWRHLSSKVRNQVRKAQRTELTVAWGGEELLPEFYEVFSQNMRDLGTPVFGRTLFRSVLRRFPGRAELSVVRFRHRAVAAALLLHGWGTSEVPSASSLREYKASCANMLLYWRLLERSVQRGQTCFDFGRSSVDSNTYRFKKQWGAEPTPAVWQYHVRAGNPTDVRPDNPRYAHFIRWWQRLPVAVTRWLGPVIVRGIP
jgi:FemAB-related protein (PEP-CTERM system-associated)